MVECFFILYIMALFIAPVPTLVVSIGAAASYLLYRKYLLIHHQPVAGKPVAWWILGTGLINLSVSLALGLTLSFGVYYLITDYFFVFLFNLLFCFLISLRWFDFSHLLFRRAIYRLMDRQPPQTYGENRTFVMISGLARSTGLGNGLVPVMVDAGELFWSDQGLKFEGVYLNLELRPDHLQQVEPVSHEKIRFQLHNPPAGMKAESLMLALREQFYPFKSRDKRNRILARLAPGRLGREKDPKAIAFPQSDPVSG